MIGSGGLVELIRIGSTPVYRWADRSPVLWRSGMAVCADGSPNAYSLDPALPALDGLANAGWPGHWYGVATDTDDKTGSPIVGANGKLVSTTALQDRRYPTSSPLRYVDSEAIPYIVLPPPLEHAAHALMGDLAVVVYQGQVCGAIVADSGPVDSIGEGSIALHRALGHEPVVRDRHLSGISAGVLFLVFPGTGERRPLAPDVIQSRALAQLDAFGGVERLRSLLSTS